MKQLTSKIGIGLAFLAMAIVAYAWWGPGPAKKGTVVTIPQGARLQTATDFLSYAGAISGARNKFYYLARLLGEGDPIQAGEFEIPEHASPATILDLLQHGHPKQRLLTVPEGMPSIIVQERLEALPLASGATPALGEGTVLPDSYTYENGEARSAIAGRMVKAMDKELAALWAKRKSGCPVATPQQALTLASIVEKETGKASERRMVAGVYCNRLRIGMKLDADPTVIYPITKGKPLGRRIKRSELDAITGYNTYREVGLPQGPIANPGKLSIAAVLDPQPTKALYFVADGTGGHVFAETLAEHNANVAKWFAIRRKRGEM
ncbi:MAG: endolytic transglycosylase MltG [Sphingomicrobium sp.]